MPIRQMVALFSIGLVGLSLGNGLIPLLPVYARRLHATNSIIGLHLSYCLFVMTAGTIAAGIISDRWGRRKGVLLLAGLIIAPMVLMMGRAANLTQLFLLTGVTWFFGGMGLTLTNILASIYTAEQDRGRVFGFLALNYPVGAVIGGLTVGPLVDAWGYPSAFAMLSLGLLLWVIPTFFLEDKGQPAQREIIKNVRLGRSFILLFFATVLMAITNYIGTLCRSVAMDKLRFSATAITSTTATSGLAALPFSPLCGWLSDRLGRKPLLLIAFISGSMSLLILIKSEQLWHFGLAISLITINASIISAVGLALAIDLIPPPLQGKGIALINSSGLMGGIIGFAGTGLTIQKWGLVRTLFGGALLPIFSVLLLFLIRDGLVKPAVDFSRKG